MADEAAGSESESGAKAGRAHSVPAEIRRLLDGFVDAAVVIDRSLGVHYHNAAYEKLTGLRPRTLQMAAAAGARCHELLALDVCRHECVQERAAHTGRSTRLDEVRALRGDGEEITLIVTATGLGGDLFVETYRDVTAESRMQRKYHALLTREREAKEELERAVEARTRELREAQEQLLLHEKLSSLGRLVAAIAHELNNPIQGVYGNVGFLAGYFRDLIRLVELYEAAGDAISPEISAAARALKEDIDYAYVREDWPRLLRSIRTGAERVAAIVANLRSYARPQLGVVSEVDLVSGLSETLDLVKSLLGGVTVERDLPPSLVVKCRGGQIQQVLTNLLTNAAHACAKGGRIHLSARPESGGARISVKDSGPGVPEALRGKIFDPFFTTKDPGQGTGLGLWLSMQIVRGHGGRLDLVSPPGEGAEFVVWLPAEPTPESTAEPTGITDRGPPSDRG